MRREYKKPNMIVTSFETIDVTSITLNNSTLTPKSHTSDTFKLVNF